MGKSCVRFKKLEAVPLKLTGRVITQVPVKEYVARVEKVVAGTSRKRTKKGK